MQDPHKKSQLSTKNVVLCWIHAAFTIHDPSGGSGGDLRVDLWKALHSLAITPPFITFGGLCGVGIRKPVELAAVEQRGHDAAVEQRGHDTCAVEAKDNVEVSTNLKLLKLLEQSNNG
jgi:hypothetical protein